MEDQPTTAPINPPSPRRIPYKKAFIAFGLLLIIGLAIFFYLRHTKQIDNAQHPYKYTYSQLNSYNLPGTTVGSGLSFKKPVELIAYANGVPKDQVLFSQVVTKNGHTFPYATTA